MAQSTNLARQRHLLKFNTLVDTSPTILSEDGKAQLKTCVHGFLVNYVFLARACALALVLRYHIVPKFHYFAHFPAQADVCSLRDTRCYLEESSVGRFAIVFRHSAFGPYHATVQSTVLQKYLFGLRLRFGFHFS